MPLTPSVPVPRTAARRARCAAGLLALGLAGPLSPLAPAVAAQQPPASLAATAPLRCIDDDAEPVGANAGAAPAAPVAEPADPRLALQALVQAARQRSALIGANRLLAEAAQAELAEARAAGSPTISANGFLGGAGNRPRDGSEEQRGKQGRVGLNAGGTLWDWGRNDRLADWRAQLAESARLGLVNAEEQVALQTVSLALERARWRLQARVWQQYGRKMACLVDGLEQIVRADRGRASELVQAQKSQQQATLAQVSAESQLRQAEIRLRRFVGDGIALPDGVGTVLSSTPELRTVLDDASRAVELQQLDAVAQAQGHLADALKAGQKPQLGWSAGTVYGRGVGAATTWSLGLAVNMPLITPGADDQLNAARKRAEAVKLQRQELLDTRLSRVSEVHEQALSAFDRARRTVDVLRDSERVRGFTLAQWRQLGRRSLFDVMSAESEHYNLRIAHINALVDGQQSNAQLWSLGRGVLPWLQ
jgi:outer membrane protein TolC